MVALEETGDLMVLRYLGPPEPGDETAYLDALEQVGVRSAPFALILIFGGIGKLSAAAERAQALWFKRTRADLNRRCRGLVIVRPGFEEASADLCHHHPARSVGPRKRPYPVDQRRPEELQDEGQEQEAEIADRRPGYAGLAHDRRQRRGDQIGGDRLRHVEGGEHREERHPLAAACGRSGQGGGSGAHAR